MWLWWDMRGFFIVVKGHFLPSGSHSDFSLLSEFINNYVYMTQCAIKHMAFIVCWGFVGF